MTGPRVTRSLASALALAACAHVTPARAGGATTDVEVSRVTLKLPGEGWTVSDRLPYGVGVVSAALTVDGERRLVTIGQPGSLDSLVMLVSATRGSRGVTVHADCDPHDDFYVRKFNRGQSTFIPLQCLEVQGPVRMPADPAALGETFGAAVAAQHARIPPGGYVVAVDVCNENGAMVSIVAVIGSHFAGLDAKPAAAALPQGMPVTVAAWADRLGEEALGTLSSWSGRMTVPPVSFTPPPPPPPLPPGVKTALAAPAALKD
ncbi:MAG TPA: hypothetical protein VIP05_20635 [Burkholderiaceae bacterium]